MADVKTRRKRFESKADRTMTRDRGLEELLNDTLLSVKGLTQKPMFGGWAWLVNGNLVCGARTDGMLVRLGKENEAWALKIVASSR